MLETIRSVLERWDFPGFFIGGLIGAIICLLLEGIVKSFHAKRRKYCISKSLVSSSVYHQTDKDGLRIGITYKGKPVTGSLSILKIRLRNDGDEDIMYLQKVSHFCLINNGLDLLDVSVSANTNGINPIVSQDDDGKYEIKWDLLKRDESIFINIVAMGEVQDISQISFEVRAEGINQIKTPEYSVREVMTPILIDCAILAVPTALFWPVSDTFLDIMPMKVFILIILAFAVLLFWVMALYYRIKWLKEQ